MQMSTYTVTVLISDSANLLFYTVSLFALLKRNDKVMTKQSHRVSHIDLV